MKEKLKRGGRKATSYDEPIVLNKLNRGELEKVVSSWAKRANEALRELERKGMTSSNSYGYLRGEEAMGVSYMDKTKKGEIKFNTKIKKQTINQLKQEASQLQTFIFYAKTYTPTGTKARFENQYKSYVKTVGRRNGQPMEFGEFMKNFSMSSFRKAVEMWGSEQAFEVYSGTYGKLEDSQMDELVNEFYERYLVSEKNPSFKSFENSITEKLKINEEELNKAREDTRDIRNEIDEKFMDALNKL